MGKFQQKVAVIVGAGRGLGRAIALGLAREGARVVLSARTQTELTATAAAVAAAGGEALVVVADATREADVGHLGTRVREQWGEPDILVNCAGEAFLKDLAETTLAEFQRVVTANLAPVFLTMREFLPAFMARGSGAIINVSSRVGLYNSPLPSVYGAAKAGVIAFTRAWNQQARAKGVQLAVIAPGPMDTPMRWSATPGMDPGRVLDPQVVADLVRLILANPLLTFDDPLVPVNLRAG